MKQKYRNISFEITSQLNDEISEIINNGGIIDSIIPLRSIVYHASEARQSHLPGSPGNIDVDKICCQEVFVLYHK